MIKGFLDIFLNILNFLNNKLLKDPNEHNKHSYIKKEMEAYLS